jgi:hypothetical protein
MPILHRKILIFLGHFSNKHGNYFKNAQFHTLFKAIIKTANIQTTGTTVKIVTSVIPDKTMKTADIATAVTA